MKNPHDVILRPVLTEKAYEGIADKRYIFEVAINANKIEIKNAIETVFAEDGVKVEKVNTPERDETVVRATANLAQAATTYVNTLNVYDILNAGKVVLTKAALQSVEEVYA